MNAGVAMAAEKSIITVVGKDQFGIIARVTMFLYENNVNVEDISQTIVGGFFNMMMIVDTSTSTISFMDLSMQLEELGKKIGVLIKLQREDIFKSMQRI